MTTNGPTKSSGPVGLVKAAELRDKLFQVAEAMFGVSLPVET